MANKSQAGRLPPQSVEAEQAVLGCMLIDPEAVPRVFHTLTDKSFLKQPTLIFTMLWLYCLRKMKLLIP